MTRISGYEFRKIPSNFTEAASSEVATLFRNIDLNLAALEKNNWQTYAIGFLAIDFEAAHVFKKHAGYRGINLNKGSSFEQAPNELKDYLCTNHPHILMGVLACLPDEGQQIFETYNFNVENEQPAEAKEWFYIAMGMWSNNDLPDTKVPWYDFETPRNAIGNYLDTNPDRIDFDWIHPDRWSVTVAASKAGKVFFVNDRWTDVDPDDDYFHFQEDKTSGLIRYIGNRRANGELM